MRRLVSVAAIAAVVVAGAPAGPAAGASLGSASAEGKLRSVSAGAEVIADQYIVTLRSGAVANNAAPAKARAYGLQLRHVYRSTLNGFATKASPDALERLLRDDDVVSVTPDVVARSSATVDQRSTGVRRTWADRNTSADIGSGRNPVTTGVAVIDSGIQLNHPDLVVAGGVNCVPNSTGYGDQNGHGTHVAGIIGARDNDKGVVGVAPGVALYAVRVLNAQGVGAESDVICGVDLVTANRQSLGITVANMSLGLAVASSACGDDPLHAAVCRSVNAGVAFAVAAGNDAADASRYIPASFAEVTTVSAITDTDGVAGGKGITNITTGLDDQLAAFSNTGSVVDIAAPGVNINSTYTGGLYKTLSGTSMASPFVAGAMAIYRAKFPAATAKETGSAVRSVAWDQGTANGFTGDRDTTAEPLLNVGDVAGQAAPLTARCFQSAATGSVPTSLRISCTDFAAGETVRLSWGAPDAPQAASFVANGIGSGAVNVTTGNRPTGAHTLYVVGTTTQRGTTVVYVVTPLAKLSVASGKVGSTFRITLSGYAANEAVTLSWDGTTLTSASTDSAGSASVGVVVPASARGPHAVTVTGGVTPVARFTYTVVPAVTLLPVTGKVGAPFTVKLTGFGASDTVTVKWYNTATSSMTLGTVTTTANGSGTLAVKVPSATKGAHKVEGIGAAGGTATASYSVTSNLALTVPGSTTIVTSAVVGQSVLAAVTGFGANETVTFKWHDSSTVSRVLGTTTATATGDGSMTIQVPGIKKGTYAVSASGPSGATARVNVTVNADLILATSAGRAGSSVSASATAFTPSETVTLRWYTNSTAFTTVATGTADTNGSVSSVTFTVPANAAPGQYRVEAYGATSLARAVEWFTVQ